MNWLHRRLCASRGWRAWLERDLLPWALDGVVAGGDVLEIGSGPGAATDFLCARSRHVTCVEIDRGLAARLARRLADRNAGVCCADGAALPLPDGAFDTVVCAMVLHHIASPARQDRVLAEAARVLRPGGTFVMLDSLPSLPLRALHLGDTLRLVNPETIDDRLARSGFSSIRIDFRTREFRVQAAIGRRRYPGRAMSGESRYEPLSSNAIPNESTKSR